MNVGDALDLDPPGRSEELYQEMPVLACEIGELDGHENSAESPASGDLDQGHDQEMEPLASWPIFESLSNGGIFDNMNTAGGNSDDNETEDETGEDDASTAPVPMPAHGNSDPLMHPLILAHNGRIFNSKNLTTEEKYKYALEGNPSFRYRKLYSNGQKSYKCWLCPTACNVYDKLVRHERRHGLESKYPCTYCDYGALAPKLLDQHISYHKLQTNPDQIKNCYLKTSTTSYSRMKPYKKRTSPKRKIRSISQRSRAGPTLAPVPIQDMELEGGEIATKEAIQKALKGNPNFIYVRLPSRENPSRSNYNFHCCICPSVFDRMDNLVRHSKLHGANKRHQCDECDISYDFPSLLESHKQKHEMQRDQKVGVVKPEALLQRRPSSSGVVPGFTAEGSKLQAALESDTAHAVRKKLITCPKCPARFYMNKDRILHLRLHGSANEFKCRFCDYASKHDFLLSRHEELHNKRMHALQLQSQAAAQAAAAAGSSSSGTVAAQGSTTADQRKMILKCAKCPAVIFSQRDFESHMGLHGSNKKFQCKHCDYAVSRLDYLQRHESVHQTRQASRGASLGANRVTSPAFVSGLKQRQSDTLPKVARNSLAAKTISTEEYHRIRAGNPEFYYKPCVRISHGRRQECTTFKCLLCPSAYLEFKHYLDHVQLHGGNNEYRCQLCDYSVNGEQRYFKHMEFHELNNQHWATRKRPPPTNSRPLANPDLRRLVTPVKRELKAESESDMESLPLEIKMDALPVKRMRPSLEPAARERSAMAMKVPLPPLKQEPSQQVNHSPMVGPPKLQRRNKTVGEYYIIDTDASDPKSNDFLIQHVTVKNFMCIEEFDAPVRTNVLSFQGLSEGKSASIVALLIGLGYDVILENYAPTSLCGLPLKDLVRRGYDTCTIALTLSLHSSVDLEEQYGSHLKLVRTLHKGLPLSSCSFEISSADMNDLYPRNSVAIGKPRLRAILEKLNITPMYCRLLLLDNVNITHIMNDTANWFNYYDYIVDTNVKSVRARLDKLMLKFDRLKDDLQWRNNKYTFLMTQLNTEYPIEDQTFRDWRKQDVQDHAILEKELGELYERHIEMEGIVGCYTNEIQDLSKVLLGRMKHRYQEFLHRQSYSGSVIVDEENKGFAIWIKERDGSEKPQYTVEAALAAWTNTPAKMKYVAVIGLFLAYWEITNMLPLFALDAYSSSENTFKFPTLGLPVLLEVIEKKCRDGHQFIATLPNSVPNPEESW